MYKKITTKNVKETKKTGKTLIKQIKPKGGNALIIALIGELGGGKTSFAQGFAQGLGIKEKVLSPTFVIMKKFQIPCSQDTLKNKNYEHFYHIDCYRINQSKEILDLGFKKIISNPQNIILIEWADKIKKLLPKDTIWVKFNFVEENEREITIKDKANP